MKAFFVHFGHLLKNWLQSKNPFTGRGKLMKLSNWMIGRPKNKMIIKTIYGFKLHIDPIYDNGVEKSIYYTGTYEAGTLFIFSKLLEKGDLFIDVGANIGLMSIYAAMKVGESGNVHAFEPDPETFKILFDNCKLNNCMNVILNEVALGLEEKEALIFPNPEINRGSSSLIKSEGSNGKRISVISLDDYIELNNISEIKLMKIDIEGYELEMLKGSKKLLSSDIAPIICIEYSKEMSRTENVGDIYDFIKEVNEFRIFKFTIWKGDVCKLTEVFSKSDMPQHDNVFCFTEKQLSKVTREIFE